MAMVILFPLTLASNAFVNPHTMPHWLHATANNNPVSHLVTAARAATNGTLTSGQLLGMLTTCAGPVAIFGPLTIRLYHQAVTTRSGSRHRDASFIGLGRDTRRHAAASPR